MWSAVILYSNNSNTCFERLSIIICQAYISWELPLLLFIRRKFFHQISSQKFILPVGNIQTTESTFHKIYYNLEIFIIDWKGRLAKCLPTHSRDANRNFFPWSLIKLEFWLGSKGLSLIISEEKTLNIQDVIVPSNWR